MKKIRFCLAVAILSLSVLSGCGMARDGYIEDVPAQTIAPTEVPSVTKTPKPTQTPGANTIPETDDATETAQPSQTPNM